MLGDTPRGVLRLGTLESTAASRLPPLLARYHEQYPDVRVELATDTTDALIEGMTRRGFEAAFVAGRAAIMKLKAILAFDQELVIIAPLACPAIACAQDVGTDTIICFPVGCAYRRLLHAWLAAGNLVPEKVLGLSSYHAIVACVASGTGIVLMPRSVLETVRVRHSSAVYALPEEYSRLQTYLVWRQGEVSLALRALQVHLLVATPMR